MAHLLADQGANLIITARSRDKLEDLAKELDVKNIQTHIFTQDISEANSAKKLLIKSNKLICQLICLLTMLVMGDGVNSQKLIWKTTRT